MEELFNIVIFLVFSAIFSGFESALLATPLPRLKILARRSKLAKVALKLKENERETLICIVIWNNIVNILLSIYVGLLTSKITGKIDVGLATAIATFLIVTFGEILPKSIGVSIREKFILLFSPLVYFLSKITLPITKFYKKLVDIFTKYSAESLSEDEIKIILDLSSQAGKILEMEKKLAERILDLDSIRVKHILVPKEDVIMVNSEDTLEEALKKFIISKKTRLVVYEGNTDNIIGYIHLKDVIQNIENKNLKVKNFVRKIPIVPEYMKVIDLIKIFKETKHHIAAVVDEYGQFIGIVTLTDIIENIFGELEEIAEDGKREEEVILDEKSILVDGDTKIIDLKVEYGIELPEADDYSTVAGLILERLSRFPKKGEKIKVGDYVLVVEDVDERRIKKVRIVFR